ncbi:hypothetical protein JOB18_025305, partial [Solea senegalensis]
SISKLQIQETTDNVRKKAKSAHFLVSVAVVTEDDAPPPGFAPSALSQIPALTTVTLKTVNFTSSGISRHNELMKSFKVNVSLHSQVSSTN